jgi:hypothetical protein
MPLLCPKIHSAQETYQEAPTIPQGNKISLYRRKGVRKLRYMQVIPYTGTGLTSADRDGVTTTRLRIMSGDPHLSHGIKFQEWC